jgi:cytochrome b561
MLRKVFRYLYLFLSWTFLAGLVYQMYTAGLTAVARKTSWQLHGETGFLLMLLALLQLLLIIPARLPKPAGWISSGAFVTIMLQVVVLGDRDTAFSALHPVLGLILFGLAWWLARAAYMALRLPDPVELPAVKDDA